MKSTKKKEVRGMQKFMHFSLFSRYFHFSLLLIFCLYGLLGCELTQPLQDVFSYSTEQTNYQSTENTVINDLPTEYDGVNQEFVLNENQPTFTQDELNLSNGVWQTFSDLDQLNRVGVANAIIGQESFPTEKRETLTIKPTGWKQKKMSDGQYLYNRCHLVGFQMTGENNNPKNLMTGTRSFNTPHMLNYENQVMDYIRLTGNHVRYRVTPHFVENELVARGIQLEAKSAESDDFSFNIYIYNVQDGYTINYLTGQATKN